MWMLSGEALGSVCKFGWHRSRLVLSSCDFYWLVDMISDRILHPKTVTETKNRSRSRKHSFATWLQNAFSGSYDVLWLSPLRAWQVWRCKSCGHGFGRAHEVVHSMLKKLSACFVDDTKPYQITSNQNLRRLLQEGHLADLSSESCQWQNDLQIYSTAIMPRIFPCLMHPKSTGCCESEVDCTDIVLTLYWL